MAYFEANNLIQHFDSVSIDVSFTCEKGSLTCLVGPSGSGKSTVLRLICGLNKPVLQKESTNRQKIILDGIDITNTSPAKRQIGMMFQNHTLFDHLTVVENVAYGLISNGTKKRDAIDKASAFLKQFELDGFDKRYPETLSGGEAQRVCLARTLIMNPKLVLFDEPLSALDAPLRKKLAQLIKTLQKNLNFTGIMVTHDLNEAKTIADNIILMKKGHITWNGKAQDFKDTYFEA